MKALKPLILLCLITFAVGATAQKQEAADLSTVKIKTSAVCGMCENTIESKLVFAKGVKTVDLDLETNEVTVEYKPRKTNPEEIKLALHKLGYDADDVEAPQKYYDKLHHCCKKDAH